MTSSDDVRLMRRACRLAVRGVGHVAPNPPVGAVISRDGEIVARGWHARFGGPHAEAVALEAAGEAARGATLHVTLEPCRDAHRKKTPPCTDAILEAGIARVVHAVADPTARGGGASDLREAGVEVRGGVEEERARDLLQPWLKRARTGLPWVVAKWAMSLDGRIATATGESQWITGPPARAAGRAIRSRVGAVLTGVGTVLADDPRLTSRRPGRPVPWRVVLDTNARTPTDARLLEAGEGEVLVAAGDDAPVDRAGALRDAGARVERFPTSERGVAIGQVLADLAGRGVDAVLCEGGAGVLGSLAVGDHLDRVVVFCAPRIIGGSLAPGPVGDPGFEALSDAPTPTIERVRRVGNDVRIDAVLRHW